MKKLFKTTLLTTALLGAFSSAAMAQDTPANVDGADVTVSEYVFQDPVATVNGREVSKRELDNFLYMTQGIAVGSIDSVEDETLAVQLLTLLAEQDVVANEAKSRGLDKTEDHKIRLKIIEDLLLSQVLLEDMMAKNEFSDADMKAIYDAELSKVKDEKEYQASHILVETEAEAQAILEAINKGEKTFAEAAKEKSLDTATAARDGSIGGWFNAGMMDPSFAQALIAMEKGAMSQAPVQSNFGFHIIVLDDIRDVEITPFEELDTATKSQLTNILYQQKLEELQKNAKVELPAVKKD